MTPGQPEDTGEPFDRRLPFGVVTDRFEVPAWLLKLEVEAAHAWALELDGLDREVRDAVLDAMP